MNLPREAVETIRAIFLNANRTATRTLSVAPNTWETSLDMAVIAALNRYSAPMMPVRDCLITVQTHFLGGRPQYHRWEIADIGLLVMYRVKGKLVRTKLVLLQSKRLYPIEVSNVQEDEQHHYRAGFSRLYREHEDYQADIQPHTFTWDWGSKYRAIKKGDQQETAIKNYETENNIPVFYLLYHPFRMGWNVSVPIWGPPRKYAYKLGTRVVSSDEMREACSMLDQEQSPSAESLRRVRQRSSNADDLLGRRFEDFIADRVLGCHEGHIVDDPQDLSLERVFFNRSAPIAAAIAITVDLPESMLA